MVSFELNENSIITNEEKNMLEEAKKMPVVFDEDSPELSVVMEKSLLEARKAKPYKAEPITVYVSPATIEKAQKIGGDYIQFLSHLLDKAVNDYV